MISAMELANYYGKEVGHLVKGQVYNYKGRAVFFDGKNVHEYNADADGGYTELVRQEAERRGITLGEFLANHKFKDYVEVGRLRVTGNATDSAWLGHNLLRADYSPIEGNTSVEVYLLCKCDLLFNKWYDVRGQLNKLGGAGKQAGVLDKVFMLQEYKDGTEWVESDIIKHLAGVGVN